MPSLEMRAEHRQTQSLSPRLQHAVRLLQMSSLDFAALVRDAMGSNPFLEAEDGDGVALAPAAADAAQAADEALAAPSFDAGIGDRDLWQADAGSRLRQADDGEMSALEMMAVETSLNTHLHAQLNLLPLAPRDLMLARVIVESLDDDGYLRTPLEELLDVAGLDPVASLQEMQIALKRVQSLEPAGVAARNVAECLRLQLGDLSLDLLVALRLGHEKSAWFVARAPPEWAARTIPRVAHWSAPLRTPVASAAVTWLPSPVTLASLTCNMLRLAIARRSE